MAEEYEFIGSRHHRGDENIVSEAEIVFVWYDAQTKDYIEILASSVGSQWGQPVHILKMNLPYLVSWINSLLDEDEEDPFP
jgi:hypothetical protein